jgi:hypothetical protein
MENSALKGLKGEVFNLGGNIAGSVPPAGLPGAIPFEITGVWPETGHSPSWADVTVGENVHVRINPDICQPPFFRLFDCVMLAGTQASKVMALEKGIMHTIMLQGVKFLFWPEIISGVAIVMIDTEERVLSWNHQGAKDGQHRHGTMHKGVKKRTDQAGHPGGS